MENIKDIYNEIAQEFIKSRHSVWPCVGRFLDKFPKDSYLLDIGCGNGKNMLYRKDLNFKGIDISDKLVEHCKSNNLDVIEATMTEIPLDNTFDGIITVASYHHLSNDNDRKKAISEMYRLLKPDGLLLIVVWAKEQPKNSRFTFTKSDEIVKWKSKDKTYDRYYHIYSKGDLENEITKFEPRFQIYDIGLEEGNWWCVVKK